MSDYCTTCGSELPSDLALPSGFDTLLPVETIRQRYNALGSMENPVERFNDVGDMLQHYDEAAAEIIRLTRELDEAKKENDAGLKELAAAYARNGELHSRLAWHPVSDTEGLKHGEQYEVLGESLSGYPVIMTDRWIGHAFHRTMPTHWREIGPLPAAPNEAGK